MTINVERTAPKVKSIEAIDCSNAGLDRKLSAKAEGSYVVLTALVGGKPAINIEIPKTEGAAFARYLEEMCS